MDLGSLHIRAEISNYNVDNIWVSPITFFFRCKQAKLVVLLLPWVRFQPESTEPEQPEQLLIQLMILLLCFRYYEGR